MKRYFATSFWTLAILIVVLFTACKNSTGPEQTAPEQPNPTDPEQTTLEITSNASVSIDENQTAVDTITASPSSDNLEFNITGGTDQDQFSIDASSGVLTFGSAPDFENPADANTDNTYQLTIEVSGDGTSASREMSVSVNDVNEDGDVSKNEAPTITSNTSFNVTENTTSVGTITASDPNGDNLEFSINSGTDQDQFSIDASSGALTFNSAPDFENPADADTDNAYEVEVEASDGQNSVAQEISVNVTDVAENQPPTITSGTSFSVAEQMTAVGTITARDPNGDTITFSIIGGTDQSQFSIDGSSGALTFDAAPDFENPADANTDNTYEVQVQASDGSVTATQNLTITVTNVNENEAPSFTSISSVGVEENRIDVHTITASDPEGDSITFSISGGADASKFYIGASSGDLNFNNTHDYEDPNDANNDNVYEVQLQISDGNKTTTQNFRANVYNDPDEPGSPGIIRKQ